jgi:hypothetical protein
MEHICFSGGARGADSLFGELAARARPDPHGVVHFSFHGHNSDCPRDTILILQEEELVKADPYLELCAKKLGRPFPTKNEYVNNLLRRNYYQVNQTERVYAVAPLDKHGKIVGGTAWAVQMAIQRGLKDIYLFDCFGDRWYTYDSMADWDDFWKPTDFLYIPRPHGFYAGIGTRELPDAGISAIEGLYGL